MARIKVTAGPGRTVPVPSSLGTAPGNQLLYLREGDELEVEESDTHVQRSLIDGDFVRVKQPDPPAAFKSTASVLDAATKES